MDAEDVVRGYYRTIDDADYESLSGLLRSEFTHYRPDMTHSGREAFVRFMREERPRTDTVHAVDAVYAPLSRGGDGVDDADHANDDADDADDADADGGDAYAGELVVRGRLCDGEGERLVAFVDVFTLDDGAIAELRTYTGSFDGR